MRDGRTSSLAVLESSQNGSNGRYKRSVPRKRREDLRRESLHLCLSHPKQMARHHSITEPFISVVENGTLVAINSALQEVMREA